jgi:alpha-beta hydrolase superfamily lysophospholipase
MRSPVRRSTREPFSPEEIRANWTRMTWERPTPPPEAAYPYLGYYGLDLVDRGEAERQDFGYLAGADQLICTQSFWPREPRGTTVLCHGYLDHAGLYTHLIRDLVALGQVVVIYDLPGHGLSTGREAAIGSFQEYVEVLRTCFERMGEDLPRPWHLVAQSTGGAVAMDWMLYPEPEDPELEAVVLLAPLVRPASWHWVRMAHALISPFRDYVKRVFSGNSNDPDFLDFLQHRDPLQSLRLSSHWVGALKEWVPRFLDASPSDYSPLILQGDEDGTVDWRFNLPAIRERFRSPRVEILHGACHHLANEAPEYRAMIRRALWNVLDHKAVPEKDVEIGGGA